MAAQPVEHHEDPLDPQRILRELPGQERANFLAAYREALDGRRGPCWRTTSRCAVPGRELPALSGIRRAPADAGLAEQTFDMLVIRRVELRVQETTRSGSARDVIGFWEEDFS